MTKNSPLKTTGAHVSIIGHITADELLRDMTERDAANGYANRFLYTCSRRTQFLPFGAEIPLDSHTKISNRLAVAINRARSAGRYQFSAEAQEIWVDAYQRLETGREGFFGKVTRRASPYVIRLSLIYALLDSAQEIKAEHLRSGLAVWQYCEDSARYIFGGQPANTLADKILDGLQVRGEMTRTEIRDLLGRHSSKQEIDLALSRLLDLGRATVASIPTFGKNGRNARPKEIWTPWMRHKRHKRG